MGTVASLIVAPTFATPPPSALAVATPDIVSTPRVLPSAVSASSQNLPVADDAQSHSPVLTSSSDSASAAGGVSVPIANSTGSGPSASFLAQLYGQGGDTIALTTTFTPAPLYNTLVQYGYVKYRPSDAGISGQSQAGDGESAAAAEGMGTDNIPSASIAGEFQAYSNTQSRNQTNLFPVSQQLAISG